jgi:hypothetical protein
MSSYEVSVGGNVGGDVIVGSQGTTVAGYDRAQAILAGYGVPGDVIGQVFDLVRAEPLRQLHLRSAELRRCQDRPWQN